MAPVVIDLTSSPEPDDRLSAIAKSALRTFQPRKQKTAPAVFDELDSPDSAARAALSSFRPRKQKEHLKNGGGIAGGAVAGALVSALSKTATVEQGVLQKSRPLESYVPLAAEQGGRQTFENQNGLPATGNTQSRLAREGSLASILQKEASQSPTSNALESSFNTSGVNQRHRPRIASHAGKQTNTVLQTSPPRSASDTQPTSTNQRMPNVLARQATSHTGDTTLTRRVSETIDLSDVGNVLDVSTAPHGVLLRPFKRRRVDESTDQSPRLAAEIANIPPSRTGQQTHGAGTSPPSAGSRIPIRSASPVETPLSSFLKGQSDDHSPSTVFVAPPSNADGKPFNAVRPSTAPGSRARSSSLKSPGGRHPLADEIQLRENTGSIPPRAQTLLREDSQRTTDSLPSNGIPINLPGAQTGNERPVKASQTSIKTTAPPPPLSNGVSGGNLHGEYTTADDDLLIKLKEVDQLVWKEIGLYFPRRSLGSLQVRYSTKLKRRTTGLGEVDRRPSNPARAPEVIAKPPLPAREPSPPIPRPQRKKRNTEPSAVSGFISWAELKNNRLDEDIDSDFKADEPSSKSIIRIPQFAGDRAHPSSLQRILRQRELGGDHGRSRTAPRRSVPDELKEHVFDSIGPVKYFQGTSGDVTCLAWSPDGNKYAAGSIAISDERSMQYNRPCNLLIGSRERGCLQELPEHHVPRPKIEANAENVNALHSMRQTQDPRLFMTVANVQFSPDGETMYSAGSDCKVRAYSTNTDHAVCEYELDHSAPLDLLSVSNTGLLATASHQAQDNCISVYRGKERILSLSPSRAEQETEREIYPSALRWGTAARHSNLLLAGFSIDSIDDERNIAGETCLWDVAAEARIKILGVTRNVFDVTWNPLASSSSISFAVASVRGSERGGKDTRSVVQCFAPGQDKAVRVIEWECPAFDINDVLFCQHDDNLLAAGGTDGKVYVWDQRFANRSHAPLHVLEHGDTLNVLDHDREREIADTGVRFISWGATSSRLYTGSSDGVVKVWNPYRCSKNAHVKDLATFTSAVMSGAFSPDYRDLLLGEDQGRINLLSVGHEDRAVRTMQRLELESAPTPATEVDPLAAARELLKSLQIAVQPMGDLPKLQAVQGPRYTGPYLIPSMSEMLEAEERYDLAVNARSALQARASIPSNDGDEDNEHALRKADLRVQDAEENVQRVKNRIQDVTFLEPQARANQAALLRREKSRPKPEIEACRLDCNYLPNAFDDDEVPDSRRSEARIPGFLFSPPPLNSLTMTSEDLFESGFTQNCMSCLAPARRPKVGKQALCERCQRTRNGLTATCSLCSAPVRPSTTESESDSNVCERCHFACFRCARRCTVGQLGTRIFCTHCKLIWEAGVLGYELSSASLRSRRRSGKPARTMGGRAGDVRVDEEDNGDDDELGNMDYYASLWQ